MDNLSVYDIMSVAYRSRLVFRSAAEFAAAMGVKFESIAAKRESAPTVEYYFRLMNSKLGFTAEWPLDELVGDYLAASEFYLSTDWGDREQLASRRRFCRMAFRLYAAGGRELTGEETVNFKPKEADTRLLRTLFADGPQGQTAVSVELLTLFAFGIIKPWRAGSSRGHDIDDPQTRARLAGLHALIAQLKDDTPRLGTTDKPLVFDVWLSCIADYLESGEDLSECTPLWMAYSLREIAQVCRSITFAEQQRAETEKLFYPTMNGIWIDDADGGRNRFWIFPDNRKGAYCYRRNGADWELDAYEFYIKVLPDTESRDIFHLLTPQGNLAVTLWSERTIAPGQFAGGGCEPELDEATGELARIRFYEGALPLPPWFDWTEWRRLAPADPLYKELHATLHSLYTPGSYESMSFRNPSARLTDGVNNLIGHDRKYIYVYDWHPDRFKLCEAEPEVFTYKALCKENLCNRALPDLDLSAEHPLYAIPYGQERRRYGNEEFDRLAEILTDAVNIDEIFIVSSTDLEHPRLVIPTYGTSIALTPALLAAFGIKVISGWR